MLAHLRRNKFKKLKEGEIHNRNLESVMDMQVSCQQASSVRFGRWRQGGSEGHVSQDRVPEKVACKKRDGEGTAACILYNQNQGKHCNHYRFRFRIRTRFKFRFRFGSRDKSNFMIKFRVTFRARLRLKYRIQVQIPICEQI